MRLHAVAEGPAVDVARFVDAIPILVRRLRTISFDDDGVGRVDGAPNPRIELLAGTSGREGARYLLRIDDRRPDPASHLAMTPPAPADFTTLTVTADRPDLLEGIFDGATSTITVGLERPERPGRLRFRGPIPDLDGAPAFLVAGASIAGEVRLHDLWQGTEPQVIIQATAAGFTIDAAVRVAVLDPTRWRVTVEATGRLRGMLRPLAAGWPLFKRRVQRLLTDAVEQSLAELPSRIDQTVPPTDGPAEVADRAWRELWHPESVR